MHCGICKGGSDTIVTQRYTAGELGFFVMNKPPKMYVCFDCMINRSRCINAWKDRMTCVCPKCN